MNHLNDSIDSIISVDDPNAPISKGIPASDADEYFDDPTSLNRVGSKSSSNATELFLDHYEPPDSSTIASPTGTQSDIQMGIPDDEYSADYVGKDTTMPTTNNRRRSRCWWVTLLTLVCVIAAVAAMLAMVLSQKDDSSDSISVQSGSGGNVGTPQNNPAPTPGDSGASPTPSPMATVPAPTTPLSDVHILIKSKMPDNGASLAYADSYQSKALEWLEANPAEEDQGIRRRLAISTEDRTVQRFALACIYYATYRVKSPYTEMELGPDLVFGWISSVGWLDEADECTWHGITCNEEGQVTEIDLKANLLTGVFPAETVLLKGTLTRLDIHKNYVYNYGDAQISWLGEMAALQDLNIAENAFHYDGIPTAFGQLQNLVDLDCSYTLFFGKLQPEIFANLPNLEYLYIGGNSYNSSIPSTFENLAKVQYFYAEYTDLTGDLSILTTPEKNAELYEVWIDRNPDVSGEIPTALGNYTNLASLSLTELDLHGALPTELGQIANMQQMWFYGNHLEGEIPSELGLLKNLRILELQLNDFQDSMPWQICNTKYIHGLLEVLGADCDEPNIEVHCPNPECCTCCGQQCMEDTYSGGSLNGDKITGGSRQNPVLSPAQESSENGGDRRLSPSQKRRHERHLQKREKRRRLLADKEEFRAVAENKKKRLLFAEQQKDAFLRA